MAAIRYVYGRSARLTVVPLQDILALGTDARMNIPGTPEGNWGWRLDDFSRLDEDMARRIKAMTAEAKRENDRNKA